MESLTFQRSANVDLQEVRRLANQHGCAVAVKTTGRLWWKDRTLTVSGPDHAMAAFKHDLGKHEEERLWAWAIK